MRGRQAYTRTHTHTHRSGHVKSAALHAPLPRSFPTLACRTTLCPQPLAPMEGLLPTEHTLVLLGLCHPHTLSPGCPEGRGAMPPPACSSWLSLITIFILSFLPVSWLPPIPWPRNASFSEKPNETLIPVPLSHHLIGHLPDDHGSLYRLSTFSTSICVPVPTSGLEGEYGTSRLAQDLDCMGTLTWPVCLPVPPSLQAP